MICQVIRSTYLSAATLANQMCPTFIAAADAVGTQLDTVIDLPSMLLSVWSKMILLTCITISCQEIL